VGVIFILLGLLVAYAQLAMLVDRLSIRVTDRELQIRHQPLPYLRRLQLDIAAIRQLYVSRQEVPARRKVLFRYTLKALMSDEKRVPLAVDLPYDVLRYLEIQIENRLGLEDRQVEGEVVEDASVKEMRLSLVPPAAGPSRSARRILTRILGVGCSIPLLCAGMLSILVFAGLFTGEAGDVDENPAWSPDGRRIAFDSNRDGNFDIFVMNSDGSEVVQLTRSLTAALSDWIWVHTASDGHPAWSPDGSQIIFVSSRDNGMMTYVDTDIYVMEADGAGMANLTHGYSSVEYRPNWSPDGKSIVFEGDRDPAQRSPDTVELNWDLYVVNADGSGVQRLTFASVPEGQAAWSPDGTQLAYASEWEDRCDIYVMEPSGRNFLQLTSGPGSAEEPDWSPDGSWIVFSSDRDGSWHLYVMGANGSNVTQLTFGPGNDHQPDWSPDGRQIAFASDRDGDLDIYVMNADGSGIVQLTDEK
jgi:tricorn protease-like protein